MPINYNSKLIPRAKELRKNMTRHERHLWYDFLKNYVVAFQRQKTIRSFIADFYCFKARLIIELDGSQHYSEQGLAYDNERDAILKSCDLEILSRKDTWCTILLDGVKKEVRVYPVSNPLSESILMDGYSPVFSYNTINLLDEMDEC
jgi:very-short-patch-repair endonuclease